MSAKETLHYLFPIVIQASEIENADALNESLIAEIFRIQESIPNSRPDTWSCDLYTTINSQETFDPMNRPPFSTLKEIVVGEAGKYARALGLDVHSFPLRLSDFWLNVYGRGHAQEVHTHGTSVVSGIYFVKTPHDCGDTIFHAPMGDAMLDPPKVENNPLNASFVRWVPQAGQMVFFRGWLKHSVQANTGDEERITIAFNLNM